MATDMAQPAGQNIVVGAGYLYIAKQADDGSFGTERYLGDTPGFSISSESENQEVYGSDRPIAEKLLDLTTQINRSATIEARNISAGNLALFLQGTATTITPDTTPVTGEEHTVQAGEWVQLGVTASDPVGARGVGTVTVTIDPGGTATSATAGTDYELDATLGRVYIIPGGGIADDDVIGVDYTPDGTSYDQVTSSNLSTVKGRVRFIADNTAGTNRDVVIPIATIRPNGELAWKSGPDRSTVMQMSLAVGIETLGALEQVYVNGRPA